MSSPEFISSDSWDGQTRRLHLYHCILCGGEFYAPPKAQPKYCSHKCYKARPKKLKTDLVCRICGALFSRLPSKMFLAKHSSGFCSRICKDKGQMLAAGCKDIWPPHYGSENEYRGRQLMDKCVGCGEVRKFLLLTHHIDGDRKHNKKENLECVCFNCHVIRHLHIVNGEWSYWTQVLTPREFISGLTKGV
jgi:hypothetical protein